MRQLAILITTVALGLVATALPAAAEDRFALALGAGIVEPDGGGEMYFMGAFRFRIGGGDDEDEGEWDPRGRPPRGASPGIRAYLEPEVGYWSFSEDGTDATDLLVGINLLGVVPGRNVDYFLGVGFGLHFLDAEVQGFPELAEDDSVLGGNLQIGLDVNFFEHLGIFGAARIDLLDSDQYSDQFKIYGGLRFNF